MKKSEFERDRRLTWERRGRRDSYLANTVALDIEAAEAAGATWEPEQWPELDAYLTGIMVHGQPAFALGGFDSTKRELAERIARGWNARRPGGEMERRLLAVIDSLSGPTPAGLETTQDEIEAAVGKAIRDGRADARQSASTDLADSPETASADAEE